jgi:hypothetical protein
MSFFPFDDAKIDSKVLFTNTEDPRLLMVEQVTYAGAIGSDHYDTIIARPLLKNIRWTKKITSSEINLHTWRPTTK